MPYSQDQIKQSRAEGRKLTEALRSGWRPAAISVPVRLAPGESCYAQGPVQIWQYLEGDGTYIHKSRIGFGLLGAAVVAGTAAGNKARASRAAQEAAPRFRYVDEGHLYLTDRRFAFQGRMQWVDFWHESVRLATCDSTSITFQTAGSPATQFYIWPIDYFFALFHFLAYGEITQIPPGPD